jgi:hypothetical protein
MSFKPGDVVIYTNDIDDFYSLIDPDAFMEQDEVEVEFDGVGASEDLLGKVGTVIESSDYDDLVAINFEFKFFNSHDLNGRITSNTGYWVHPSLIRHAITEPLKELEEML